MNQNQFQPAKKPAQRSPVSFVEALKSIGSQTTKTISNDLLGKTGNDFMQSITGSRPNNYESSRSNELTTEDRIREEAWKIQRHRELTETKLFDRKAEEVKQRIKAVQDELKMLAKELAGMDKQLEKAIEEEIVTPGTYHISFFEKLRRIIIDLRKRVADSSSWLETSNQRKAAQQGYWGKVSKSGTKFMLSQERTLATQSG